MVLAAHTYVLPTVLCPSHAAAVPPQRAPIMMWMDVSSACTLCAQVREWRLLGEFLLHDSRIVCQLVDLVLAFVELPNLMRTMRVQVWNVAMSLLPLTPAAPAPS